MTYNEWSYEPPIGSVLYVTTRTGNAVHTLIAREPVRTKDRQNGVARWSSCTHLYRVNRDTLQMTDGPATCKECLER